MLLDVDDRITKLLEKNREVTKKYKDKVKAFEQEKERRQQDTLHITESNSKNTETQLAAKLEVPNINNDKDDSLETIGEEGRLTAREFNTPRDDDKEILDL